MKPFANKKPWSCVVALALAASVACAGKEPADSGGLAYAYGTAIVFGEKGNEKPYLREGWSFPEPGFRWTDSGLANLALKLPIPDRDLVLRATFAIAFVVPGKLERQRVVVIASGSRLAEWSVTKAGSYEATIPKALAATGNLALTFQLPDAAVAATLMQTQDDRRLAVALQSLVLSPR